MGTDGAKNRKNAKRQVFFKRCHFWQHSTVTVTRY